MPDQFSIHVAQAAKSCSDPAILCWMESHPGLASWAQFAGSMLAIMIALLAAWLPRHFDKLDRRSRARRARPLLGEAMAAVNSDALQLLRCSVYSPNDIEFIDLRDSIGRFEKISWADLSDRDHSLGMFAYRHANQLALQKEKIENNIKDGKDITMIAKIVAAQLEFLQKLYSDFLEDK